MANWLFSAYIYYYLSDVFFDNGQLRPIVIFVRFLD